MKKPPRTLSMTRATPAWRRKRKTRAKLVSIEPKAYEVRLTETDHFLDVNNQFFNHLVKKQRLAENAASKRSAGAFPVQQPQIRQKILIMMILFLTRQNELRPAG
jgi:hypothetical protein